MQQIVNVTIDSKGNAIPDSKSIGLQYETGVTRYAITPDASWVSDQYFYYIIVSPPEDSDNKQYAVPLVNQGGTFIFEISSGITWHVGNYKFAFLSMSKPLVDGQVPNDGVVGISESWNGKITKSILDYIALQKQPEDANFQLLYTDLMALSVEVRNKSKYAQEQGDYAKEQGNYAKTKTDELVTQAQYAAEQGNYAKEQGNNAYAQAEIAKNQAEYAKTQGGYAKEQGEQAQAQGNAAQEQGAYAETQGRNAQEQSQYAKTQGDYAKEEGNKATLNGTYAKEQGDYTKTQGDYAKTQGNYAKEQGNYANEQGTYAKEQGDNANKEAENAKTQAEYAQEQGNYVKDIGDNLEGKINRLYANQPKGTASGTEIVVQDSAELESVLQLSGNSEQDSRSGKNLLKKEGLSTPLTDKTFWDTYVSNTTSLEDGWCRAEIDNSQGTGYLYANQFVKRNNVADVVEDTEYTIFYEIRNLTKSNNDFYLMLCGDETTTIWNSTIRIEGADVKNGKYCKTIKTKSDLTNKQFDLRNFLCSFAGNKVSLDYRMMIVKGSYTLDTIGDYEPYGVQPSPDYPSEIRSVSGDVELKVEGKNKANAYNTELKPSWNNVNPDVTIIDANNFEMSTKVASDWHGIKFMGLKTDLTYSITFDITLLEIKEETVEAKKICINSDTTNGNRYDIELNTKRKISSKVTPVNGYIFIGSHMNTVKIENIIIVEKETLLEPYEPYKLTTVQLPLGDIELRSTPDGTRDTFERVDGVWNNGNKIYSERILGENVRNYQAFDKNDSFIGFEMSVSFAHIAGRDKNCMCNRFIATAGVWNIDRNGIWMPDKNRNVYITIQKNKLADVSTAENAVASFKTWLAENPLYVDYVLAEPTYTPITDQALISALDELEQLILHKGYNYITATSVNGVKAQLDLSYIKDINIVLNNMSAMIMAIGGELNV